MRHPLSFDLCLLRRRDIPRQVLLRAMQEPHSLEAPQEGALLNMWRRDRVGRQ